MGDDFFPMGAMATTEAENKEVPARRPEEGPQVEGEGPWKQNKKKRNLNFHKTNPQYCTEIAEREKFKAREL